MHFVVLLLLVLLAVAVTTVAAAAAAASTSAAAAAAATTTTSTSNGTAAIQHVWIFKTNTSFVYTHMSMIETLGGKNLVTAWQASGYTEGCNDQRILLSHSSDLGQTWTQPTVAVQAQYAVWGPVLFFDKGMNRLWLFFTQSTIYDKRNTTSCGPYGKSAPGGEIRYVTSADNGKSWSASTLILTYQSRGQIGKMTANPLLILPSGRWLLPFWQEKHTVYDVGVGNSGVLVSDDSGASWKDYGAIFRNDTWLIENTLALYPGNKIQMLFRTKLGYIYQSWSSDGGLTWSNATATPLENPDSKVCMRSSGSGTAYLAFNPSKTARCPLYVDTSATGTSWTQNAVLDSDCSMGQAYEYPTPLPYGTSVYTTYSADTRIGIKLAISPAT